MSLNFKVKECRKKDEAKEEGREAATKRETNEEKCEN
ncbi:uncharacterized protein G2W53_003956 [Senna tora]|uniref:Uncharacterized protein n=1 Tax=Senna tora TaxID=362788 RepID=A0A834X9K7_9FABA|nr:uncharacterized protein G2W53_003956 [Senna tora]